MTNHKICPRWRSVSIIVVLCSICGSAAAQQTVGLFLNDSASYKGYSLFTPLSSQNTYLIDNAGKLVQSWSSAYTPGNSVYLLEDGNLLRTAAFAPGGVPRFTSGGKGGRVEEYSWEGSLVWSYNYSSTTYRQHHDIAKLPNGNVLMVAWEYKSYADSVAAGRSTSLLSDNELWPDTIIEIEPSGMSGGTIVWEWHVWDHLIQDNDPTRDNFGAVADHPELIDLNYTTNSGPQAGNADWNHTNSVDYNAELDQIVVSIHGFSEIWVIDHSTTTVEAAGHTGGDSGMGGDLLYRWGNPQAYRMGDSTDRQLFKQHDAQWIAVGLPGAGNLLIFNNGAGRPGGNYSSVDEIIPPVDASGSYALTPGSAFDPTAPFWSYTATPASDFFAQNISGAQRLPNGNTLVCSGPQGRTFEVTSGSVTVWDYSNSVGQSGPITQGNPAQGNSIFRMTRYDASYPGLVGRDLTPGDPLELYTRPSPVPDGSLGTQPLTAERLTVAGDQVLIEWDAGSCPVTNYNLLYGTLSNVSTYSLLGSECALGGGGSYLWTGVPDGDLFWLIVGEDATSVYESSWGTSSAGVERNAGAPSAMCNSTTRDDTLSCQ